MTDRRTFVIALTGLGLCLCIPALGQVHKYLGAVGVLLYLASAVLLLPLFVRGVVPWLLARGRQPLAVVLAGLLMGLLVAALLIVYPIANAGLTGGSDRDEALDLAATALLAGRYPYTQLTYLGNPISPLPGAVVLALPFVLLGGSAWQNGFWLVTFAAVLARSLRNSTAALLLVWLMLAGSPVVLQQLVTGGDLLANSLYVLLFVLWLARSARPLWQGWPWSALLAALLLGIGLSSRANFLLLLPVLGTYLGRRVGWWSAAGYIGLVCATTAAITLPFWLADPAGFSPLHTFGKLDRYHDTLTAAGVVVTLLTGWVALGLAARQRTGSLVVLLANCALVQAVPVGASLLLANLQSSARNAINLEPAEFGLFALVFGATAAWVVLIPGGSAQAGTTASAPRPETSARSRGRPHRAADC